MGQIRIPSHASPHKVKRGISIGIIHHNPIRIRIEYFQSQIRRKNIGQKQGENTHTEK